MRRLLPAVGLLCAAVAVVGQQPNTLAPTPRLQSAFPAGGQVGTTVELTLLGTDFDDAERLVFSHPGLKAEPPPPPPEPPAPPADPKKKDPPKPAVKKKAATVPTEAKFRVTVAANVPPGTYDVRLANKWGVSNPRPFVVSDRTEINEKEPNNDIEEAQKIALETVVNGVLNSATDVEYFAFAGKKGQRVIAHVAASSITSKARPLVEIYGGADGRKRLGGNRNSIGTDALVDVQLPADGTYFVRVVEFAHTVGGPDSFYRLTLTAGPWIDAAFPNVVPPGKPTPVTLYGRNLPGGKPSGFAIDGRPVEMLPATVTAPAENARVGRSPVAPPTAFLDGFEYRFPKANSIPIYTTTLPVIAEPATPNDTAETAVELPVPCEAVGRIDRALDRDWYKFAAKKGDVLYLELIADRLGGSLDSFLLVKNPDGSDLVADGTLDDDVDSLHPTQFFSRSGDPPAYKFTAAADGVYRVMVGSREASVSYGPRCGYRLVVRKPSPGFRGVVMAKSRELPQANTVRPDGDAAFDVFVQRLDGFVGPVTATATGLPAGVTAKPLVIGPGQRWGTLLLSGAAKLTDADATFAVSLTGTVAGKSVAVPALPASITWGIPGLQNVPTITRLDQTVVVATRNTPKAGFRLTVDLTAATKKGADGKDAKLVAPFLVRPGEKLTVPVKLVWQEADARTNPVQVAGELFAPNQPQPGLTVNNNQPVPMPKEKAEVMIPIDVRPNAVPGVYTIAFQGTVSGVKLARDAAGKDKKDVTLVGFAPPVELFVVPASLGKLSAQGSAKIGATGELVVKVERQYDFAGEFAVTLTFPEKSGLSAKPAVIPAGVNEVKVPVVVAKDAKPGTVSVTVAAVAQYDGKYATPHEMKVNVTVVK